jgi:hypothetical protein
MAQMHPSNNPAPETTSNAEKRLYRELRTRLAADFHVFHKVERYAKAKNGRYVEGEIDFLILHPEYGVLVLEVKGGRISRDPATGKWTTTNQENETFFLKESPFTQVNSSARYLKDFLEKTPETQPFHYPIARAVWFYGTVWQPMHLPDFPDALILDSNDIAHAQDAIERVFVAANLKRTPGKLPPEAIAAFSARFDPIIESLSLAVEIHMDAKLIDYWTNAQCERLNAIRRLCHLAIPGAAGTGKTIMAFETAKMYAKAGCKTLLVCVNEFQAQWLQDKMDAECTVEDHFEIFDIKTLCDVFVQRANLGGKETDPADIVTSQGQTRMAQRLQRSIERLKQHQTAGQPLWNYQAIIIDEGQDIERPLLQTLSHMLRDPQRSGFYLFYDPEQRLDFTEAWRTPLSDMHTMPMLHDNLRNTSYIHDAMIQFQPTLAFFAFNGPRGRPIDYLPPSDPNDDEALKQTLAASITDLLQEGIKPDEIMVVTCRTNEKSRWKQWQTLGEHALRGLTQLRSMRPEDRARFVKISTIRAAKGLESNVVILVEPDGVAGDKRRDKLLYVAISRAKHHLVVLGQPADILPTTALPEDCADC